MTTLDLTPLTRALAALQRGLLRWQATPEDEELRVYRDKRNITSHTYDAAKAAEVAAVLPAFAQDAAALLRALEQRAVDAENAA